MTDNRSNPQISCAALCHLNHPRHSPDSRAVCPVQKASRKSEGERRKGSGCRAKSSNEQVRRNRRRFPADFIFRLTREELENLMSQYATSRWGGRRKLPYVFTEHGAIQAATILSTRRAVDVSVYVVRAFVQLRGVLTANRELAKRLDELESRIERKLDTHDRVIADILDAIRQLMSPPEPKPKRRIGFTSGD